MKHLQAKIGKEKAVELALRRLRGKGADIFSEAAEIKVTSYSGLCS